MAVAELPDMPDEMRVPAELGAAFIALKGLPLYFVKEVHVVDRKSTLLKRVLVVTADQVFFATTAGAIKACFPLSSVHTLWAAGKDIVVRTMSHDIVVAMEGGRAVRHLAEVLLQLAPAGTFDVEEKEVIALQDLRMEKPKGCPLRIDPIHVPYPPMVKRDGQGGLVTMLSGTSTGTERPSRAGTGRGRRVRVGGGDGYSDSHNDSDRGSNSSGDDDDDAGGATGDDASADDQLVVKPAAYPSVAGGRGRAWFGKVPGAQQQQEPPSYNRGGGGGAASHSPVAGSTRKPTALDFDTYHDRESSARDCDRAADDAINAQRTSLPARARGGGDEAARRHDDDDAAAATDTPFAVTVINSPVGSPVRQGRRVSHAAPGAPAPGAPPPRMSSVGPSSGIGYGHGHGPAYGSVPSPRSPAATHPAPFSQQMAGRHLGAAPAKEKDVDWRNITGRHSSPERDGRSSVRRTPQSFVAYDDVGGGKGAATTPRKHVSVVAPADADADANAGGGAARPTSPASASSRSSSIGDSRPAVRAKAAGRSQPRTPSPGASRRRRGDASDDGYDEGGGSSAFVVDDQKPQQQQRGPPVWAPPSVNVYASQGYASGRPYDRQGVSSGPYGRYDVHQQPQPQPAARSPRAGYAASDALRQSAARGQYPSLRWGGGGGDGARSRSRSDSPANRPRRSPPPPERYQRRLPMSAYNQQQQQQQQQQQDDYHSHPHLHPGGYSYTYGVPVDAAFSPRGYSSHPQPHPQQPSVNPDRLRLSYGTVSNAYDVRRSPAAVATPAMVSSQCRWPRLRGGAGGVGASPMAPVTPPSHVRADSSAGSGGYSTVSVPTAGGERSLAVPAAAADAVADLAGVMRSGRALVDRSAWERHQQFLASPPAYGGRAGAAGDGRDADEGYESIMYAISRP